MLDPLPGALRQIPVYLWLQGQCCILEYDIGLSVRDIEGLLRVYALKPVFVREVMVLIRGNRRFDRLIHDGFVILAEQVFKCHALCFGFVREVVRIHAGIAIVHPDAFGDDLKEIKRRLYHPMRAHK